MASAAEQVKAAMIQELDVLHNALPGLIAKAVVEAMAAAATLHPAPQQRAAKTQTAPPRVEPKSHWDEPWRIPVEEFIAFRDTLTTNWSEGGNAKTAKMLAMRLKRGSGPAEGQLYLDWAERVGHKAVEAWWKDHDASFEQK